MWSVFLILFSFILQLINVNTQDDDSFETTTNTILAEGEEKMSEYILRVLEYYKQSDSDGLPGINIPDPYLVPDMRQSLGFGTNLEFKNTALHGVNKFRLLYLNADIRTMESRGAFEIDKLQIQGNYSLNMWLNSYRGSFTAEVIGIKNVVLITLGVEEDGKLRAQNISIDMTFESISVHFENAGFLAAMLQGVFNSMGNLLYDSIKPYILDDTEINTREVINNKLDQIVGDIEFPNTISPLDMIMVDIRNKMKDMKMDPLRLDDYNSTIGMFRVSLNNTWIKGLSSFHTVGNISLSLENKTVVADLSIGMQDLQGTTQWELSGINGFLCKTGSISFLVNYIKGRFVLSQAMDTRQTMEFKDLNLEVGNIQILSEGLGTLDYVIEVLANILPTFLRYQIMEAMQNPIRWKIQQELDRINIEEAIINELPVVDQMQEEGFQLAALRILNSANEAYNDDEFFNF